MEFEPTKGDIILTTWSILQCLPLHWGQGLQSSRVDFGVLYEW